VNNTECRWRWTDATNELQAAWETGCGQWCVDSESTPDKHGFRNGFVFCPYCGQHLVLILKEIAA
jgi:hypothetical protein